MITGTSSLSSSQDLRSGTQHLDYNTSYILLSIFLGMDI